MDLTKYHGKGQTGLENLGNTCFLNSCLQVVNHMYELNEFLDSSKYEKILKTKTIPDKNILIEWNDLRSVMWSGNGVVTPRRFVHNVQQIANEKDREIFTGFAQNDMPEFLLFFIECIHNSISRGVNMRITGNAENKLDELAVKCYEMLKVTYAKEYSEIMDFFYGIYVSEIIAADSNLRHSINPECYFILNLPILDSTRHAASLIDCFDIFTESETMEGDNAWFNEKTNEKENVKKQISFWNFPKILIITLQRFSPDGTSKLNTPIDFPLDNLDLSKYVRGYNPTSYKYDLFGICNHMGGPMGGHYTAFVKNSENNWMHFNDNIVEMVDKSSDVVTPLAYCLFYRKQNNIV
jgi:ubiquitin carboxyl-terminal hydrolase 8